MKSLFSIRGTRNLQLNDQFEIGIDSTVLWQNKFLSIKVPILLLEVIPYSGKISWENYFAISHSDKHFAVWN